MAGNTVPNVVYSGTGPTQTGQILAQNLSDPWAQRISGTATSTGDNTSASITVNFIDGTKTIGFTPSVILCGRIGGTATATTKVVSCVPVGAATFTVTMSATIGLADTVILGWKAFK